MFVLTSENWTLPMQINCKIFTFCRIGLIPSYIPNTQYVSVQKVLIRFGFIGHCYMSSFNRIPLFVVGYSQKKQARQNQSGAI